MEQEIEVLPRVLPEVLPGVTLEEKLALGLGVDNFPGSDTRISGVGLRRAGADRERKLQNELDGTGLE